MRGGIGFRKRRKWNTQVEPGMRNDEVVEVGEKRGIDIERWRNHCAVVVGTLCPLI